MSSQLITAPDLVDNSNLSILLINPSEVVLEIVVASCRNLERNFNIYLSKSVEDPEWFSVVMDKVDKIFKDPDAEEIYKYLKLKDSEEQDE